MTQSRSVFVPASPLARPRRPSASGRGPSSHPSRAASGRGVPAARPLSSAAWGPRPGPELRGPYTRAGRWSRGRRWRLRSARRLGSHGEFTPRRVRCENREHLGLPSRRRIHCSCSPPSTCSQAKLSDPREHCEYIMILRRFVVALCLAAGATATAPVFTSEDGTIKMDGVELQLKGINWVRVRVRVGL